MRKTLVIAGVDLDESQALVVSLFHVPDRGLCKAV